MVSIHHYSTCTYLSPLFASHSLSVHDYHWEKKDTVSYNVPDYTRIHAIIIFWVLSPFLSWGQIEDMHPELTHLLLSLPPPTATIDIAEIPASEDLKFGESLFFTTPPPHPRQTFNEPHPQQIWEWLRTLWSLTWDTYYQNSRSSFWWQK